jgi:hypothetical protein
MDAKPGAAQTAMISGFALTDAKSRLILRHKPLLPNRLMDKLKLSAWPGPRRSSRTYCLIEECAVPLRVQCHYCRNTINVAEHLRGCPIRCPFCQQATKVPGPKPMAGRPRVAPAQRMPFPRPAGPRPLPVAPMLPDRATRMPPRRTHFEGVDVPDHVYQEDVDVVQLQEEHVYDADEVIDASEIEVIEQHESEDIPVPLKSRKRKSRAKLWLGLFLVVVVVAGGAAGAIWFMNNN